MTEFTVIKNVPLPQPGGKYPFTIMEVGDAFDAPRDMGKATQGRDRRQNVLGSAAHYYVKRSAPTAKFSVRIIDKDTVRCQRIA